MAECLQYIFCCFSWGNNETQRGSNNAMTAPQKKKKTQKLKPKPPRIISKYRPEQTIQVQKEDKKKGKAVYTCPICMVYYNRILACNQCQNNICRFCSQSYEKKFELNPKENMKCPFCNSETSNFVDYEEAARSYFDTTGKNGFLDPAQRKKIDEQMNMQRSLHLQHGQNQRSIQLYRIDEDQANQNIVPTENNIGLVENYVEVQIRRNPSNIEEEIYNEENQREQQRQQSSIANLRNSNIEAHNQQQRAEMLATV